MTMHTAIVEKPATTAMPATTATPKVQVHIDLDKTFRFRGDPPPIQKHFAKSATTELLEELEAGEGHGFPSLSNKESHSALQRVLSAKVKGIMKTHPGQKYVTRTEKDDSGLVHIMVYRIA
jgi:hypothetical protein